MWMRFGSCLYYGPTLIFGLPFLLVGCDVQRPNPQQKVVDQANNDAKTEIEQLRRELDGRAETLARHLRDEQNKMLTDAEKRIKATTEQQIAIIESKVAEAERKANDADTQLAETQQSLASAQAQLAKAAMPNAPVVAEEPKEADIPKAADKPAAVQKKPSPATARLIQAVKKIGGTTELDAEGSIIAIDLSGAQVSDATLIQLRGLASLTRLNLEGTAVNDMSIARLFGLKKLIELRLAGTQATETEADKLVKAIPGLQVIWKPSQRFQARIIEMVKKFGGEIEIEKASTGESEVVSIDFPYELNLDVAQRRFSPVTDALLQNLRGLNRLRRLTVYSPEVTDAGVAPLATLHDLEVLRLEWANMNGSGLIHLGGLPKLSSLYLHGSAITDVGLANLSQAIHLEFLNLDVTAITGVGFRQLSKLQRLEQINLGPNATDVGLQELASLKGLRNLHLYGDTFTDAGIARLKAALPQVTVHRR